MNFQSFRELFLESLKGMSPRFSDLQITMIQKNNGVAYTGLFLRPDSRAGISPVIYLEPLYERFMKGESPEALARETMEHLKADLPVKNAAELLAPEYFRSHVVVRLVGAGQTNASLPEDVICRQYLDMYVTYAILIEGESMGPGMAVLKKSLLSSLDCSEEELFELALENTRRLLGEKLLPMHTLLEMTLDTAYQEEDPCPEDLLYVLSNRTSFYGASTLLYGSAFRTLAKKHGTDLYILPSSVHELILTPVTDRESPASLKELVTEVNEKEVRSEEVLTNSVYQYLLKEDRIIQCA